MWGLMFDISSMAVCLTHCLWPSAQVFWASFLESPFTCSLLGWLHSHLTPGAPRLSSLSKWLLFLTVHNPFYHRLCYNTDAKRHYSNQLRLWNLNWWCIWKKYVIGVEFQSLYSLNFTLKSLKNWDYENCYRRNKFIIEKLIILIA